MLKVNVKNGKEEEFKRAVSFSKDSKNRKRAIDLFTIALEDRNYRVQSVNYLVDLYLKNGNYLQAREILRTYGNESNLFFLAKLENVENNYQKSKYYYQKVNNIHMQQRVKLALARNEFQLGNYEKGRELLDELKEDRRYIVQVLFDKCRSYILEKNYEAGYEILHRLKTDKMVEQQLKEYNDLNVYLSYFLGRIDEYKIEEDSNIGYWQYRFFFDNDKVLLSHIAHHKNARLYPDLTQFINTIDLEKLLDEIRERIPSLNPNRFNWEDRYMFHMDKVIGYVDGTLTNGICVDSVFGTDKILTMYPVLLSDEFDREGNGTSERLRRKREMVK